MRGRKPEPILNNPPVELKPPGWMSRRQKMIWRQAVSNAPTGLLSQMDGSLLANWVIACDTYREACEKARGLGLIVKSPNKGVPMQNPYLAIINRQAEIMMKAAGELGFTPISRTRLAKIDPVKVPKVLTDEPQGKKAQAQAAAVTAQNGTDWEGLLNPSTPLQ